MPVRYSLLFAFAALAALPACETARQVMADGTARAQTPASAKPGRTEMEEQSAARGDGEDGASLALTVSVENPEGTVMISLLKGAAGWQSDEPVATFSEPAAGGTVSVVADDLAPGQYGIKVFQDLDGDGELTTNLLGIPSEPYAFSNNAPGRFGVPDFEAAAFEVGPGRTEHTIRLD